MNYYAQTINFREVQRGDSFGITLIIADSYPLDGATVKMQVRPYGDFDTTPILTFQSGTDISISGQEITITKSASDMSVRHGRFTHDMQFTKDGTTNTLYKGLFEITDDITS